MELDHAELQEMLANDPYMLLVDVRDEEEFDAGHIPGAINRPFTDNFDSQGCFKSPAVLREEWQALLQGKPAATPIAVYCGSGVSTIPNLLSLQLAGYPRPALYAGSWSAWCATPDLPVERG